MSFRLTSPKPPKLAERDVIRDSIRFLQQRGYWCHRNPVGKYRHAISGNFAEFGPPGIPDYTAIHRSFPAFFLEFKQPGARLRESQISKFAEIQLGYGLAAVMIDRLEDLVAFVKGHEERTHCHSP